MAGDEALHSAGSAPCGCSPRFSISPTTWPVPLDLLGDRATALRWFWWEPAAPSKHGWRLQLAVEDVEDGHAWAINAVDAFDTAAAICGHDPDTSGALATTDA